MSHQKAQGSLKAKNTSKSNRNPVFLSFCHSHRPCATLLLLSNSHAFLNHYKFTRNEQILLFDKTFNTTTTIGNKTCQLVFCKSQVIHLNNNCFITSRPLTQMSHSLLVELSKLRLQHLFTLSGKSKIII